ncbi:deoxynucleoside triphosphate triphosphohydrolase SAMHD1-like isoform X1 [Echeneis naucrates]|uniref:deoxynucleoside triphosphate triphosphohydrolase SAMHD1-like isoform X1 n=1 Tax=Echeneis naucrates TaxID=173247 RepID=UPI0011140197|nr:deoxynucleoside triphosphate triphosphohydrolase SAMHD1-like isoform X1 [Echeneis naucrates]
MTAVEGKRVFNDPIHGHVELHPLLVKMINTPQFNRLRYIKQMAGAYFVFPGACHNRFEHSIGVAHLAGELIHTLQQNQPELGITERDKLCVQIAGLCHDLGHGPFSHLFDQMFIPKARPNIKWEHEENSVKMLDYMVRQNQLEPVMEEYGLKLPEDMEVIKEMIRGKKPEDRGEGSNEGRPQDKFFLYEIVANKTNGIDVDKFDYFARDCHHLGIQNHFDHLRFFRSARVIKCPDGLMHICSRDKEVHNLYAMFYARCSFHRKACQHKTNKLIETMITDAFLKADKHIMTEGSGGESYCLSEAIDDMQAYTKLTDNVFEQILHSSTPELDEARNILDNIVRRRLYKCLGQTQPDTPLSVTQDMIEKWEAELAEAIPLSGSQDVCLQPEDFIINVIDMDYGMKKKNPINNVRFYCKDDITTAVQIRKNQVSKLLPEQFAEQLIRVYCKKRDRKILEAAKKHFVQWCINMNFSKPQDGDIIAPELTPLKLEWKENNDDDDDVGAVKKNGKEKARVKLF